MTNLLSQATILVRMPHLLCNTIQYGRAKYVSINKGHQERNVLKIIKNVEQQMIDNAKNMFLTLL